MDRDGSASVPPVIVLGRLGSSSVLGLGGLPIARLLTGFDLRWIAAARRAPGWGCSVLLTVVPLQTAAALLAFAARDGTSGGSSGRRLARLLAGARPQRRDRRRPPRRRRAPRRLGRDAGAANGSSAPPSACPARARPRGDLPARLRDRLAGCGAIVSLAVVAMCADPARAAQLEDVADAARADVGDVSACDVAQDPAAMPCASIHTRSPRRDSSRRCHPRGAAPGLHVRRRRRRGDCDALPVCERDRAPRRSYPG
jgi:hypothetical protein